MKFYDNRFDFLRYKDENITEGESGQFYDERKDYLLPKGENVVTGSTCYYVNTGDFFIYHELPEKWINQETFEEYEQGTNPYYSGGDEPVPSPIG
mgnify:FL=1